MAEPNMDDLLAQFQSEISQVETQVPDEYSNGHDAKRARSDNDEKSSGDARVRPRIVSAVAAVAKAEPVTSISITMPAEPLPEPESHQYEYKGNGQVYVDPATLSHGHYGPGGSGAKRTAAPVAPVAPAAPSAPLQNKKFIRAAGGTVWEDDTLNEWPESDFRLFVGDLGNEVTSEMLAREFMSYSSFQKAKVIRDKHNNKSKGYGFVSFLDPLEAARAIREKNGRYIGHRPMKIRKSEWQGRNIEEVKKKEKKKRKLQKSLGLA